MKSLLTFGYMRCEKYLISSRNWSNPKHNFILKNSNLRLRPTSYFMDFSKPASEFTATQLSYMAYAQFKINLNTLDKLQNKHSKELENRLIQGEKELYVVFQELNNMIRKDYEMTAEAIANYIVVSQMLMNQLEGQLDVSDVYSNLLKQFDNKVGYMSVSNLIDIMEAIIQNSLITKDQQKHIVNQCLSQLSNRQIVFQPAVLRGNEMDKYEYPRPASSIQSGLQSLCSALESGLPSLAAKFKKVKTMLIHRTHNEKRIYHDLQTDFEYDSQTLQNHLFIVLDSVKEWDQSLLKPVEQIRTRLVE